jgi:NAD(P)-dependent dehydrogenase (short-subunit alcohol dehydrogenase family)
VTPADAPAEVVTAADAALAEALAAAGAKVVVADRDDVGARRVASGVGGLAVGCDVSRDDEVQALVDRAEQAFGPVALFTYVAVVAVGMTLFAFYRMTRREAVPLDNQTGFVAVPPTAGVPALDPRTAIEPYEAQFEAERSADGSTAPSGEPRVDTAPGGARDGT